MSGTNRFEEFRAMLLDFVRDPANGYCPEGREVESLMATRISEYWEVKIIFKDRENAEPKKVSWLRAAGPDKATRTIFVEEVVAWMWRHTQLQLKALSERQPA